MLSKKCNNLIIRNYLIATASVTLFSIFAADLFNHPARVAQQNRLDRYGGYISAALVNYAKSLSR